MNKKLLYGLMIPLLAVVLVSAGVMYYATFSASFNVEEAITVSDNTVQGLENAFNSEEEIVITGEPITITNNAPTPREITLTDDSNVDVSVSYIGTLELTMKDSEWTPTGATEEITYTVIGDTFEVTGVPVGYTAIYYKDEVVGLENREANPQPAISIVGVGNLPHIDDANMDELANYCETPDEYNQCKGAKIWLVPNGDLDGSILNWANMFDYYYETDLIQYNAEGNLVMSGDSELVITPVYTITPYTTGNFVITTTIA